MIMLLFNYIYNLYILTIQYLKLNINIEKTYLKIFLLIYIYIIQLWHL